MYLGGREGGRERMKEGKYLTSNLELHYSILTQGCPDKRGV